VPLTKDGVHVTESNQDTTTVNGKVVQTQKPVERVADTKAGGKFTDKVGAGLPPDKVSPADAVKAYNSNAVTIVDKQTMTLTLPNGCTCTATDTRTTTNTSDGKTISPGGYTLTTTQPVVTTPQPPQ
jgi:hypothetical protein